MSEAEGLGFYMTQLCTIYEDEKLKAGVFGGLKIIDTNLILFPILVPQMCIKGCHNRICGIRIMKTSKGALKKSCHNAKMWY